MELKWEPWGNGWMLIECVSSVSILGWMSTKAWKREYTTGFRVIQSVDHPLMWVCFDLNKTGNQALFDSAKEAKSFAESTYILESSNERA